MTWFFDGQGHPGPVTGRTAALAALLLVVLPAVGAAWAPARGSIGEVGAASAPVSGDPADPGDRVRGILRFDGAVPAGFAEDPPAGIDVGYAFSRLPAVVVAGDAAALDRVLAAHPGARFDPGAGVSFATDEARHASRVAEVVGNASSASALGLPSNLTGAGVGIALVDSGVDVRHPDLDDLGRVAARYTVSAAGVEPVAEGDGPSNPHGTRMAGILVGSGNASGGRHRGVAPGATVTSLRIAEERRAVAPAVAFDWILEHGPALDPPIRVVVNAWTCPDRGCPGQGGGWTHVALASRMADAGLTMVFAVGNSGGDGGKAETSTESTNPTPGVVGVANHEAEGETSTACTYRSSARGHAEVPGTWPDVAAPGQGTVTAEGRPPADADDDGEDSDSEASFSDAYTTFGGSSAAAGHLGGVVALMHEAAPDLTPADVERYLKATARKVDCGLAYVRADPAHPWGGANYASGHGLVDAVEAVRMAIERPPRPPPVDLEPLPDAFLRAGARFSFVDERIDAVWSGGAGPGSGPSGDRGWTMAADGPTAAPAGWDAALVSTASLESLTPRRLQAVAAVAWTGPPPDEVPCPLTSPAAFAWPGPLEPGPSCPPTVTFTVHRAAASGHVQPMATFSGLMAPDPPGSPSGPGDGGIRTVPPDAGAAVAWAGASGPVDQLRSIQPGDRLRLEVRLEVPATVDADDVMWVLLPTAGSEASRLVLS